ncbi:DEAD/DEAH box helicase [Oceanispirochaeta crateris]|uniref:DEAD/DEAH box helicase n=1 Tax=Oceanispirochaeta crateris TaxID=2518645 RepID=UPI001FE8D12A|nr:DEAD/DEAH box helicase [Oceanispirochaeta crateris]
MSKTEASDSGEPRALVLAPTRELAEQVGESFISYGQFLELRVTTLYGGAKMGSQETSLKRGTDIVIATPGRLKDHLEQKNIDLSKIEILVLDEADRMLDMGFINDIKSIIGVIPKTTQNLLFSATYGNDIEQLAKVLLKNPVSVEVSKRNTAAAEVSQILHFVDKKDRFDLLAHLITEGQWYQVLVFVKTKHSADRVASQLNKVGIPSEAIHGDKRQGARSRALKNFIKGDLQALVATDVAARGIDLKDLSHVVNFELPQIPEDYIHRIGRTGRAGKKGVAISLVSFSEKNQLLKIEKILKAKIPQVVVKGFEPKHDINKVLKKNRDSSLPASQSKDSGERRFKKSSKEKPASRFSKTGEKKASGKRTVRNENSRKPESRRGKAADTRPSASAPNKAGDPRKWDSRKGRGAEGRSSSTRARGEDRRGASGRSEKPALGGRKRKSSSRTKRTRL